MMADEGILAHFRNICCYRVLKFRRADAAIQIRKTKKEENLNQRRRTVSS